MTPRPSQLLLSIAAVLATGEVARGDTNINFFGDVDYYVDRADTTTNSFQASTLDIFAQQTEGKFGFIGEVIIEAFGSNEFGIDVDRLEVSYTPTPWLRLRAGRIRSAFGYYGDAYQNGKFFMMPVSWPEMYEGAGFDGILPSHSIGLHVDAAYGLGGDNGKLTLDAEVLNGRGADTGEVTAFQDGNNDKALNFRLRYVGDGRLGGLIVGANIYLDQIPLDPTGTLAHPAMHELILGGHAVYVADHVHFVSELAWLHHREDDTGAVHNTTAFFAEAGYDVGDFTPYVRYENMHFGNADPYFVSSGIESNSFQRVAPGVKYVASASVAFKLEAQITDDQTDNDFKAIAQAAFAF